MMIMMISSVASLKIDVFFKQSFRNNISVSITLEPDQAQYFVGPDLIPICLKRQKLQLYLWWGKI